MTMRAFVQQYETIFHGGRKVPPIRKFANHVITTLRGGGDDSDSDSDSDNPPSKKRQKKKTPRTWFGSYPAHRLAAKFEELVVAIRPEWVTVPHAELPIHVLVMQRPRRERHEEHPPLYLGNGVPFCRMDFRVGCRDVREVDDVQEWAERVTFLISRIPNMLMAHVKAQLGQQLLPSLILPSPDNMIFINSKTEYMRALHAHHLVDPSTIVFEASQTPLDTNRLAREVCANVLTPPHRAKPEPGDTAVIKGAFSGNSNCVEVAAYMPYTDCTYHDVVVSYVEHAISDSLEWQVETYGQKDKYDEYHGLVQFKCAGMMYGAIVQRLNPYVEWFPELRCFCVDGVVVAVVAAGLGSHPVVVWRETLTVDTGRAAARACPFVPGPHDKHNERTLTEQYMASIRDNNTETDGRLTAETKQSIVQRVTALFSDPVSAMPDIERLVESTCAVLTASGHPMLVNRIDVVWCGDLETGRWVVNEVEDITFGAGCGVTLDQLLESPANHYMTTKEFMIRLCAHWQTEP